MRFCRMDSRDYEDRRVPRPQLLPRRLRGHPAFAAVASNDDFCIKARDFKLSLPKF